MISAPAASCASRMTSIEAYLPVPTIRRDVNSLPPRTRLVSYMVQPPLLTGSPPDGGRRSARTATQRPTDLDLVTLGQRHHAVVGLAGDFTVDRDGRVLALDVEQGEQAVHGDHMFPTHALLLVL